MHLADYPPGHPSPEQRRAVRQADARARSLLPNLGSYATRWVHAPGAKALAETRYPRGGPAVWIRDDLSPEECFRVALHELRHVADADVITEISQDESERRAEAFVAQALRESNHDGGRDMDFEEYIRMGGVSGKLTGERAKRMLAQHRDWLARGRLPREIDDSAEGDPAITPPLTAASRHWGCVGVGRLRPLPHAPGAVKCDFCGAVVQAPGSRN